MKKPKKPSLKVMKRPLRRAKAAEARAREAIQSVPRITNDTVGVHREEVLSSARKYIYPLQQSKHSIVRISLSLFALVIIAFLAYCGLALYKFQSTSGFIYDVTRVLPFPVAKAGHNWVSYESYLFELRRNMHYYQSQQQATFTGKDGHNQLVRLKQQALGKAVQDAYVKQLAAQNGVTVSDAAVNNQVTLVRNQNRLGTNERVFKEVLDEFWGWSENDFKRELKQELLQQAVVARLDTATQQRAQAAFRQVQGGADFTAVAAASSQDLATKGNGGQYPTPITPTDRNQSPQVVNEVFRLKTGQISPIINTGYTLEIIKVLDANATTRHAAHIEFVLKNISTYVRPLEQRQPSKDYIKV